MQHKNRFMLYVFIGLILGLLTGYLCFSYIPSTVEKEKISENFNIISSCFIRLIQMIIAPLIISTLITGLAKNGNMKSTGRIGIKALFIFLITSFMAIAFGLVMVNIFQPGDTLNASILPHSNNITASENILTLKNFVLHIFPKSIVESMANNEILQVVIFSIFFGIGLSSLGERGKNLYDILDIIAQTMFKVTNYVMKFAPIAIFASITALITKHGLGIIGSYGIFMGEFYITIILLLLIMFLITAIILPKKTFYLLKMIREPALLAFITASSEAAFPKTLEQLEKFGIPNKTASFVLPLGYSFNLIGSMIYCAFGTMFIAQAYKIYISPTQQIIMLLVLMLTSKGIAGVPRASILIISAVLGQFNIPQEGLLLLVAVDHFFDMGRSAINVIGNALVAGIVAKWEKEI